MFPKLRFILFCAFAIGLSAAHAATVNVGPGQPYTTIQSGINGANNGDTVLVAPGIYVENIDFKGKAITVTSSGGAAVTIIDGSEQPGVGVVNFISGETRSSVISNFTIRNGGGSLGFGGAGGGVAVSFSAPTILNNVIAGNNCNDVVAFQSAALIQGNTIGAVATSTSPYPCYLYAIFIDGNSSIGSYSHTDVIGNMIADTGGAGVVMNVATSSLIQGNTITGTNVGIYATNTDALSIIDNLTYGNAPASNPTAFLGISILAPYSSVGPFIGIIEGNTIGDGILVDGNLAQYVLVNNLIVGAATATTPPLQCDTTYSYLAITPASFDHNDIYWSKGQAFGSGCISQVGVRGNLSVDPLFVNPAAGNFQLQANSPVLDAGNNGAPSLSATDILGSPRIQNALGKSYAVVDMGAYERSGTTDAVTTITTLTPSEYFASANPSPPPPPLTFTVTVSGPANQFPGTVTILADGLTLGKAFTIPSAGSYLFTPPPEAAGLHSYIATFQGQTVFSPSVNLYLLIPGSQTSVTLNSSPNPAGFGNGVTFSISSSSNSGTFPSPIVLTDTSTGTVLATLSTTQTGGAIYSTSALLPGTHTITAAFAGSSTQAAASATVMQVVGPIATSTSLAIASPASGIVPAGAPVTLSIAVHPAVTGYAAPTGTITFYDNATLVGTATLTGSGNATFTFNTLSVPANTISCMYSGDTTYAMSTCNSIPLAETLTEPVGTTSPVQTATLALPAGGTVASIAVLTQGAANLDYRFVSGGTCAAGSTYPISSTCTVEYTFTPAHPGSRPGAVTLTTSGGAVLSTTYIAGQGTGPQLTFLPLTQAVVSGGLIAPYGVAIDGMGDLFVVESGLNRVVEIAPGGGLTYLGTGLNGPKSIAIDGAGNLFVNCQPDSIVREIVAAGGYTQTVNIGTGFRFPAGIAVDQHGNLFVADSGNNAVKEVLATGGYSSTQTLGTFSDPTQLAVDAAGNLFVVFGGAKVEEVFAAGGYTQSKALPVGSFGTIQDIVVDGIGNVVLDDANDPNLEIYSVANGYTSLTQLPLPTGMVSPAGFTIDSSGNIYVADITEGEIYEAGFSGPPSLTFQTTPYGQTSKDSPQTVTLTNAGNAPLLFTASSPAISPGFPLAATPVSTCPVASSSGTLAAGSSCTYSINYTPLVAGPASGMLVAIDNNLNVPGATQTILLNGVATGSMPTIVFNVANVIIGVPPFAVTAQSTSAGVITYSVLSGPATISGNMVTVTGVGTVVLQASQAASGGYLAGTQTATFSVTAIVPTIVFNVPNQLYNTPPFAVTATSNSAGAIAYSVVSGPATISGNIVTLTGSGTVVLQASQAASAGFVAGSVQTVFTVSGGPPAITFGVPNHTLGDPPFIVSATSNSTGAFTYSVISGPATISGSTVTLTGAGIVVLQASEAAGGLFGAGTQQASFTVVAAPATISFAVPNHTFGDAPFAVAATSNSTGAFTYSVVSGPAAIAGNTVTLSGAGTVVLQASELAAGNYAATSQTASFIVAKAAQTINFAQPASPIIYGAAPFALSASATSGGAITFSVLSGPATISGNTVSITGTGTVVLAADQGGSVNYNAAPEASRTVLVYLGSPSVNLSSSGNTIFVLNPITFSATVSSAAATPTGSIVFRDGATVLGTVAMTAGAATLTSSWLALGPHSITAAYSGDNNFAASNSPAIAENVQDFSIVLTSSSASVIAHGGTVLYNITLAPIGGATMPAAIGLAVSGQPGQSQISFTPQIVASGSGVTGVTLKIQTPDYPTAAVALVLGAFLLSMRRRIKPRVLLAVAGAAVMIGGISGCGSGWPSQNFQIVVAASSGALAHTAAATLISQ